MPRAQRLQRIAIVDRGEAAIRLIDAVAEHNAQTGDSLRTIALVTDLDRRARFAREAHEVHHLGPALVADRRGGQHHVYRDHDRLGAALRTVAADAVWPGWGLVAEDPAVAELCAELGIAWIGPDAATIRRVGDRIVAKQLADSVQVDVVPWSGGAVSTVEEARAAASRLGYPVMVKPATSFDGRLVRRVESVDGLEAAFAAAAADARSDDDAVFVEKVVTGGRHIEVQVAADGQGAVWAVGVRDATVQRRGRRILHEAPAPSLDASLDALVRDHATRVVTAAGYVGVGTVELLHQPTTGELHFLEITPRLQPEHAVTEATTGVDLVKLQLHLALGGALDGPAPTTTGAAVGVRIRAEDPERGFAPTPGPIDLLRLPAGPGIRVDTGVDEGDELTPEHDPLIATVVAVGRDRSEALARLDRALRQTAVVIRGGATTTSLLRQMLSAPDLRAGEVDVDWVERRARSLARDGVLHAEIALVAAAIAAYAEQTAVEVSRFRSSASRGRPQIADAVGSTVELRHEGHRYRFVVFRTSADRFRVEVEGVTITAIVDARGPRAGIDLTIGGRRHHVRSSVHGVTHQIEVDGHAHRIRHDEGGVVRATSPAIVVSIPVAAGDVLATGDLVAVIEAMKMETAITAEFPGRVREVLVSTNAHVDAGAPLVVVDPDVVDEDTGPRVRFDALAAEDRTVHVGCRHRLETIRNLLLGYDVGFDDIEISPAAGGDPCGDPVDAAEQVQLEEEILSLFVDVIALFRRNPLDEELDAIARRSTEEYLFAYLRRLDAMGDGLPDRFLVHLRRTLAHFGVTSLEPSPKLETALYRIARSHQRMPRQLVPVLQVLENRLDQPAPGADASLAALLDRIVRETRHRFPAVHDLAAELRYQEFDQPFLDEVRDSAMARADEHIDVLVADPTGPGRTAHVDALVDCPQPLKARLSHRFSSSDPAARGVLLEVMTRRYYRTRDLSAMTTGEVDGFSYAWADYNRDGTPLRVVSTHVDEPDLEAGATALRSLLAAADDRQVVVDLYVWRSGPGDDVERTRARIGAVVSTVLGPLAPRRVVVALSSPESGTSISDVLHFTFRPDGAGGLAPDREALDIHPMMAERLQVWRLAAFELEQIATPPDIYLFRGRARDSDRDERLFALAEVRDFTAVRDEAGTAQRIPELDRVLGEVLGAIRRVQARRPVGRRLHWNRVLLYVWPTIDLTVAEMASLAERMAPDTADLGIEKVQLLANVAEGGTVRPRVLDISNPTGDRLRLQIRDRADEPLRPLDSATRRVVNLRQRGLVYPFDLVRMLAAPEGEPTGVLPPGTFQEHDLDGDRLVPVDRPDGENRSNVVVGVISNVTATHPEGMRRVILLGDPTRGMGSLSEPECRRINAAMDLADEMGVPVEWFAVSGGALISMESGTENMYWIARVLRRIIEFTQAGGEMNIVVAGINVGAQPYWNAEATMLMHTKGILVMTPNSAMVLTGKDALDYSGGVSAEDNQGVGGYERIMGPNGQAQYFARDLHDACRILMRYYDHSYVAPGERFPRPAPTNDPRDRDVRTSPHGGDFATVGDVFSAEQNPDRKRPFEIRKVMAATVDQDHPTMERWYGVESAELAVVWEAHLGGYPVCLLGIESKNLPRLGYVPADGPSVWTSGTLFPMASKKIARAINAASGNRPLVVLANLSGFDGSPESLRQWQLEYGAEIGRAVVNFRGPIVFCVVSRYHGGAFVVFSGTLHDNMEVVALEGSRASVIGGAPAAAVVFAREVQRRTAEDPELLELERRASAADGAERAELVAQLATRRADARTRHMGEVAAEFDTIHDVERALRVGSLQRIISAAEMRPYLIDALERGMARELERLG